MDSAHQESTLLPEGATTVTESEVVIPSHEILQGRREIWIEHEGQKYRLRVTSRGKLYLTK
jgi:hemin uptake protein HemP